MVAYNANLEEFHNILCIKVRKKGSSVGRKSRSKLLRRILNELASHMEEHFAVAENTDPKEECEKLYEIGANFVNEKHPNLSEENSKEVGILIAKLLNEYFGQKARHLGIQDVNAYLARAWVLDD